MEKNPGNQDIGDSFVRNSSSMLALSSWQLLLNLNNHTCQTTFTPTSPPRKTEIDATTLTGQDKAEDARKPPHITGQSRCSPVNAGVQLVLLQKTEKYSRKIQDWCHG